MDPNYLDLNDPSDVASEIARLIARARKQVQRGEATRAQAIHSLRLTLGIRESSHLYAHVRRELAA